MSKAEFKLDIAGLNEVMKSDEMQAVVGAAAAAVARNAGSGFDFRPYVGSYAAMANVFPDSKEAASRNYKENALVKAVGAAGLRMK